MERNKIMEESEDWLRRKNFDEGGFKGESRRGFIGRIANISHWWEITKERLDFLMHLFLIKGRL